MILTENEYMVAISDPHLNYIFRNLQAFKKYGLESERINTLVQNFSVPGRYGPEYSINEVRDFIRIIHRRVLLSVFVKCNNCSGRGPSTPHIAFGFLADVVQCTSCNRFLKNRNVTAPIAAAIEVYYP